MLWLKNEDGEAAPTFWTQDDPIPEEQMAEYLEEKKHKMETFADAMTTTNPQDISCRKHEDETNGRDECIDCKKLVEKVEFYQTHRHTFSCHKKMKTMTIQVNEGHGKNDGKIHGNELKNIPVCRHNFPKFPMEKTKFLVAPGKELDEDTIKGRRSDHKKIVKFLVRQTYSDNSMEDSESCRWLKSLTFLEFLYEVGMFKETKPLSSFDEKEIQAAKQRYYDAISCSIKGTGLVFLKRDMKHLFINAFNPYIMRLNNSNHDLQIVVDMFAVAQYICAYLTKNEAGLSKLLKAVNEEFVGTKLQKINAIGSVIDKKREVSIQEAVYRLLGLPMTKCSRKVKYLSCTHPNFRDGLVKGNLENEDDDVDPFHNSPHLYYENRPFDAPEFDLREDYWDSLCFADFHSNFDIVYGQRAKTNDNLIKLRNNKGFIRKRGTQAILRYYLNFDNDEDLCRGLLILFFPFWDEMTEIHEQDVIALVEENRTMIEENRARYEKYKVMTDLINQIQRQVEREEDNEGDDEEEGEELETTTAEEIQDFEEWVQVQTSKDIASLKEMTDIPNPEHLRQKICSLNTQQRRLFDDICERVASNDCEEPAFYIFISGSAGTGI